MLHLLTNKEITGLKIGDWKSTETPDGTILWTKPKKLFVRRSPIGVYATPHFDTENEVSVDVVNLHTPYEGTVLSCKIYLHHESNPLAVYVSGMEEIFSIIG